MQLVCLDLEGVLVPEIWIEFAERTGIEALKRTTRDEPDYDKLMRYRLDLLRRHRLRLSDIEQVIAAMRPLAGAAEFLDRLRARYQVVVLSDTFYEFAGPLMQQLGRPTLFCHRLEVGEEGYISDYRLRMPDQKRAAVRAFQGLRYRVIAAGDSYNDTAMLAAADAGIFFRPPAAIAAQFPQFRVTQ
ncbi:MAG: bifunctional phosphoserine phosphatase/homoserine phosphotransferase ThrH, partial [Burkholderiales bacterium]